VTVKFPQTRVVHKRNPATKDVFFAFLAVEWDDEENKEEEEDNEREER